MKNKLKFILTNILVFVLSFAFVACQSPDNPPSDPPAISIVGEWKLIEVKESNYTLSEEELALSFGEVTWTFNENGTGISNIIDGGEFNVNFEWELEDDELNMTCDGIISVYKIEFDDDKIILKESVYTYVFEKK